MDTIIELLSDVEQVNIIIQNIAGYVIYVYPGIISIYLYNFFIARTTQNTQAFIIKSFAISYLYNLFLQTVFFEMCFWKKIPEKNSVAYNILLIIVAFLIPYCCHRLKTSKVFTSICGWLGISTSVTNVPFELLGDEEEKYTCLKIYLRDEPYVYTGYLGEYEYEDGQDKYVILTGYKKYYVESTEKEKVVYGYNEEDYNEKVFIRFSDIKIIEKIGEKRAREQIYQEENRN